MYYPTDRITHTTAFVTPFVEHWLEREIAQWVHHEGSIRRPIAPCYQDQVMSKTSCTSVVCLFLFCGFLVWFFVFVCFVLFCFLMRGQMPYVLLAFVLQFLFASNIILFYHLGVLDLVHLKKDRTDASTHQQHFMPIRDRYHDYIPLCTDGWEFCAMFYGLSISHRNFLEIA